MFTVKPSYPAGISRRVFFIGAVAYSVSAINALANELQFDQAFSSRGEPPALHYQVTTESKGVQHRLEVWRDGDRRLKRRTDDAMEIYVVRKARDGEFQLSALDLKKRIHTRIDRTNLFRIGNFTDWYDLAHGLKHPTGSYQLDRSPPVEGRPAALERCSWYDLNQQGRITHVCWSETNRIPLLILSGEGTVLWRVTALDRKPVPEAVFAIQDAGYIQNNANRDIEGD